MKFSFTITLFVVFFISGIAQTKPDIVNYINRYKRIAIDEMIRSRIPASVTIAQGILESSCGRSPLSREANNHFGIKCKDEWTGKRYYHDDDSPNECFRVYEHAEASYLDHSDFLLTRPRYAPLFQLAIDDYRSWAKGLKSLGYATNPAYAERLITYIETYDLSALDKIALSEIAASDKLFALSAAKNTAWKNKEVATRTPERMSNTNAGNAKNNPASLIVPREECYINDLRAVRAIGEEDPLKIAFEYQIDYSDVLAYNDLSNGDRFKPGEFIYLESKKSSAEVETYSVKPGEHMRDIAQRFGIKLKDLYQKNLMHSNEQAYAGEIIYLQEKRSAPPRTMTYEMFLHGMDKSSAATTSEQNTYRRNSSSQVIQVLGQYEVQQSDTLYSIARKFNTTVDRLKKLNQLSSAEVKAGQVLVVAN